jgi:branched-chain amino acid transport system substrate-binding protein
VLDSKAITKTQSIILIAIVVVAAVGVAAIVLFGEDGQSSETIKIGVCTDLGSVGGDATWRGAVLASEQINIEGGILGKQIELISADTDYGTTAFDPISVSTAINRLITLEKVDFVIGGIVDDDNRIIQEVIAEHKKIFISVSSPGDQLTEQVLNDYEKYKYFFKVSPPNSTATAFTAADSFVALREYTGFNKIGYLAMDVSVWQSTIQLIESLPELQGFELVYNNKFPPTTIDFSSYFAAAEAAGVEILVPMMHGDQGTIFIKEWYDRQSPLVIWGYNFASPEPTFWESTEGKCAHETVTAAALSVGYPVSSKSLPFLDDYNERWGEVPNYLASGAYDIIRFILPDALARAGTLETEEVIKALEEVDIETPTTPRFVFTSSHDVMYGSGYNELYFFQWQADGTRVPVYPRELREEAGATYTFPDWSGPWDNLD